MAVRLRRNDGQDVIIEATLEQAVEAYRAALRAKQPIKIQAPSGEVFDIDPGGVIALEMEDSATSAPHPDTEAAEAEPAAAG